MAKWDVILIGGGFSGLAAGALFAEKGKKVLVLEKTTELGGRAYSSFHKNHIIDNGPHGFATTGHVEEIYSRLGMEFPEIVALASSVNVMYKGKWNNLTDLFPHKEIRKIMMDRILAKSWEEVEQCDDIALPEWVSQSTDDELVHLFFNYMGWLMCVGSRYESISAGECMSFLKEVLERHGGFSDWGGKIRGGYATFTKNMADACKARGVEVKTGVRVNEVIFDKGKVKGVTIETGSRSLPSHILDTELLEADMVVSTLPIWDFFTIVKENNFPAWYVDWVKHISTRYSNLYTLYYGVKETPIGEPLNMWWTPKLPRLDIPICLSWQSSYGESVGEYQGTFFLQANWFDGLPGENIIKWHGVEAQRKMREVFEVLEQDINDVFPEFEQKGYVWKLRSAAPYCTAAVPGTCRAHRPGTVVPGVENFYLIGDTLKEARPGALQTCGFNILNFMDNVLAL